MILAFELMAALVSCGLLTYTHGTQERGHISHFGYFHGPLQIAGRIRSW